MNNNSAGGKTRFVLISGASTGIGLTSALSLIENGFHVFAGVRKEADAVRLLELTAKKKLDTSRMEPVILDVTSEEQIAAVTETISQRVGDAGLDGLVNNAGIAVPGPLAVLPLDALRYQLEVNLVGHLAVIQSTLPLIKAAKGRIVNMGSTNGFIAPPFIGSYAMAKHALEALTDSLRIELDPWGIKVLLIEPCPVKSEIWDSSASLAEEYAQQMGVDRIAPYRDRLDCLLQHANKMKEDGIEPEGIAINVVHALTSPRPSPRYYIHLSHRLACKWFHILPESLQDWIMRRQLKF